MQCQSLIVTELRYQRRQFAIFQRVLPQHLKICQLTLIANFRGIFANQLVKNGPHRRHLAVEPGHQFSPVITVHCPRKPGTMKFILWQRLSLLVTQALQQIFQPPQEQVGISQCINLIGW